MGIKIFSRLLKKRALKKPGPGLDRQNPLQGKAISDEDLKTRKISRDLKENKEYLLGVLGQNADLVTREINPGAGKRTIWLVYLETLVDNNGLSESILKPLMLEQFKGKIERLDAEFIELIEKSIITAPDIRSKVYTMDKVTDAVLSGSVALFVDGYAEALLIGLKNLPQRGVEKADIEVVVRGPKESFAETIEVNTALIRRRLRSPNLVIEGLRLGRQTNTTIAIAYLKGVVSPELVQEVRSRIERIDIDAILDGGYIEELIQDDPYSPFPQLGYSERPDRVVSTLLQGRVGIIIDGTPMVLYVPVSFTDMLQSPEDYYEHYHYSTAIRLLRFLGLIISLLLPSFYIAITTFHQEMIPTQLLISIVAYREGVPFPAVLEALIMEMTFEALREAGIRLPRAVGQAISIVGALVIGQAAVQAGFVSPLMVIIVALTGIASFMIPAYNQALSMRLIRFPFMLLAATLGLFGVVTGLLAMLIHMAGLRSFGVPYLTPLAPLKVSDLKDTLVRAPWWAMRKRPSELVKRNEQRMAPSLKPHPPGDGDSQSSVKPVNRNDGIRASSQDYGGSGKDQGPGTGNPPRKGVVVVGLSFKKKVLLLLLISWLLSQTGCWDHIEAEQLGIIGIIGLDQAPEGKLRVTLQIINPKALAGGGQTGGGGGASISTRPYRNISAEGNTIMECIRLLSLHAPSRLFFAHNQTILISEELARNRDIETIVDFFDRNQQFRRNNYVLVSRSDISSVIGVPGETQVPATQRIPSILRQQFLSSFYPRVRLGDFLENLECDGKDVYAMGIQVEPNEAEVREKLAGGSDSNAEDPRTQTIGELVKISGTAVFRGNRMAGWLNERESRGLLWVNGEVKGGVINVPCSLEQKPGQNITVAMEILRNKSKIEPGFIDGKLNIIVKIDTVVTIQEVLCMEELGQPEIIESLEEALVSAIQTEVEAALAKAQHEYQSDVFGFGLAVYRKYPDIWKELKPDWAEIYRNLPVYLEIDARISRTGLISKPVEVNH